MRRAIIACAIVVWAAGHLPARTFDFKVMGTRGASSGSRKWWGTTERTKSAWFRVKVGGATKIDDMRELEIRAGTVLKSVKSRQTGVNDVATFKFRPINVGKPLFFLVSTGTAFSRAENYRRESDSGWQVAGCIIEVWQGGKMVKHWSNVPGSGGKSRLTDSIKTLRINAKGYEHTNAYSAFGNATEIYSVNEDDERVGIDELLKEFEGENQGGNNGAPAHPDAEQPKTCYMIRDKLDLERNRNQILRCLDSGALPWCVQKRTMTKGAIGDFRIENPNGLIFESVNELRDRVLSGKSTEVASKWYLAVRDVENVTLFDKRFALEELTRYDRSVYHGNILKRKFTEEELKDFKALNPNCKLFRDVTEFKDFIRNVKSPRAERPFAWQPGADRPREEGVQGAQPREQAREPSPEELKKIMDAEEAHEREMLKKKFDKEVAR